LRADRDRSPSPYLFPSEEKSEMVIK
jgi:hypothetical protein